MSGRVKLNITESTELSKPFRATKNSKWEGKSTSTVFTENQVETVQHLAVVLGRNRVTVQRWLSQYRSGGLNQLLEVGKSTEQH